MKLSNATIGHSKQEQIGFCSCLASFVTVPDDMV